MKPVPQIREAFFRIALTTLLLATQFYPATASALQSDLSITIQPPLVYQGHIYTVEYKSTGQYQDKSAVLFFTATPDFFNEQGITGLIVRRDGAPVSDEALVRKIFILYTAAFILYERLQLDALGSIPPGFREDLQRVTRNPFFIEQQIKGLFKNREEQTLESVRAILTPQLSRADVDELAEGVRTRVEQGNKVVDALDETLTAMKFSNSRMVRDVQKDARDIMKEWRPVTEQGTAYVEIGRGQRVSLANALDIISLGTKLLAAGKLSVERSEWLATYQSAFTQGEPVLDSDQVGAAVTASTESQNAWVQRGDIIVEFARDRATDTVIKLASEELARRWVQWTWQRFGKRISGHLVGGVAAAASLGLTLGDLLYGLDDLFDNFRVAERADELRLKFRAGRLEIEQRVKAQSKSAYNGDQAEQYRAAYMLEALAASQGHRSYADGVAATVRNNWLGILNPLNWFKGTEWRMAVDELRRRADQDERAADDKIGHPAYVDTAVALVLAGISPPPTSASTATLFTMDISDSMNERDVTGVTKIEAARRAATLNLRMIERENQAQQTAHQVGIVTFNNVAAINLRLTRDMAQAQAIIQSLSATGGTNMYQGLELANEELAKSPPNAKRIAILLSDGVPTSSPNFLLFPTLKDLEDEVLSGPVNKLAKGGACIYAIGLGDPRASGPNGPSLDEDFLRRITASAKCGAYYNAQTAQQLEDVYIKLRLAATGTILQEFTGQIAQGQTVEAGRVAVPAGKSELRATLNWPGSALDFILVDPSGRPVDTSYPGASLFTDARPIYYIVKNPVAGQWVISVFGKDVPERTTNYSAIVATSEPAASGDASGILFVGLLVVTGAALTYAVSRRPATHQPHASHRRRGAIISSVGLQFGNQMFVPLRSRGLTIGRAPDCDAKLRDTQVSRQHARITREPNGCVIQDLGSANGTYVNKRRVTRSPLRDGDQIRVGKTKMVWRARH